jgi:hypothetical protein
MVRPVLLNSSGSVAVQVNSQPGAPGQLVVTGGEKMLVGFKDPKDGNRIHVIEVTVPAATINFPAQNTKYIVRLKTDSDGTPSIYYGTSTVGYPLDAPVNQDATGTQDASGSGFPATLVDAPLIQVNTQSNGQMPTYTLMKNTSVNFDRQIFAGDIYVQGNLAVTGSITGGSYLEMGDDAVGEEGYIKFLKGNTNGPRLTVESPASNYSTNALFKFLRASSPTSLGVKVQAGSMALLDKLIEFASDGETKLYVEDGAGPTGMKNYNFCGSSGSGASQILSTLIAGCYYGSRYHPSTYDSNTLWRAFRENAQVFAGWINLSSPSSPVVQSSMNIATCTQVATGRYRITWQYGFTWSSTDRPLFFVLPTSTTSANPHWDIGQSSSGNYVEIKFFDATNSLVDPTHNFTIIG